MSENIMLIVGIPFLIAFWAAAIWLFFSKTGMNILRAVIFTLVPVCAAAGLYMHWEPYVAMVCLTVGFAAGVLFAEWHYDIKGITALRSDLQRRHQLLDREDRFQQAQRFDMCSSSQATAKPGHEASTYRLTWGENPQAA